MLLVGIHRLTKDHDGRQVSGLVIESCEAMRLCAVGIPIAFGPGKRLKPIPSWFRIRELFDRRVGATQAS
jgi:hypothetical protein